MGCWMLDAGCWILDAGCWMGCAYNRYSDWAVKDFLRKDKNRNKIQNTSQFSYFVG
jgi:hypothetical protein